MEGNLDYEELLRLFLGLFSVLLQNPKLSGRQVCSRAGSSDVVDLFLQWSPIQLWSPSPPTSDLFEFLEYSALPAAPTATLCKCKRGHMQSLCKSTVWQKSHETGNPNPALSILPRNLMPNIFPLATDVFFFRWQQWLSSIINVLCGDIWSESALHE